MRRIPGHIAAASAVKVTNLHRAFGSAAGVVSARMIRCIGKGASIRLRAGQDVVLIGRAARALGGFVLFRQRGSAAQVVAQAGRIECVAMQVGNIFRNCRAGGVVPRASADAIASIDGGLAVFGLRAQVGVLGFFTADRRCQCLAMLVGAGQSAQVGAFARAGAGNEKAQWLLRLGCCIVSRWLVLLRKRE